MSIDPNTLPDGTVVETNNGALFFKDGDGRQFSRLELGDGCPFEWDDRTIVRTYTPDPTPDQEVPRDEWANIKPGSRVRIVEINGDEHTVTVDCVGPAADVVWLYDEDHDYDGAKIARVYLLDAPTPPDPDAEAVEVMARAAYDTLPHALPWDDRGDMIRDPYRREARAVLVALREHTAALKVMLADACWRCSDGDGATCDPCLSELVAAAERDAEARTVLTHLRGMFDPMTGRPAGGGW